MNFVSKHHQRGHGLSACADQGSVYWRRDQGLVFGIVAGMKATGEKVLIVNDPVDRSFQFEILKSESYNAWFLDTENPSFDHVDILERAFVHLNTYGRQGSEKYAPSYKFEFTSISKQEKTVEFDRGIFKIVGHLLLFKETKSTVGRMFRGIAGLPKKGLAQAGAIIPTETGQSGVKSMK